MKAFEETWAANCPDEPRTIYRIVRGRSVRAVGTLYSVAEAQLAACAPELVRMLLARDELGDGRCSFCGKNCEYHDAECAYDALLRKAGVR